MSNNINPGYHFSWVLNSSVSFFVTFIFRFHESDAIQDLANRVVPLAKKTDLYSGNGAKIKETRSNSGIYSIQHWITVC